jgi:hypothetical protein
MPRNGSGTYSLPIGNPVVTGTTISSTWANNTLTDISNALTGSLSADGQTTASGNLNMGTNKVINLADPTNAQDAATKYYVDQLIVALGTMAYQNANAVAITGGAISNVDLDLRSKTNEIYLPVGPTALRTASPINGLMRFNTDAGGFYEGYINGNWQKFVTVNEGSYVINYLIIGGGGGGSAGGVDGGGGAGQVNASSFTAIPTNVFTIYIGGGGAPGVGAASSGSSSSITGISTAVGGGGGGSTGGTSGNGYPGGSNGSGGGGGSTSAGSAGGGGGGSGGNGGAGTNSVITGSSVFYAGGGGGGGNYGGGSGGSGGGGNGGYEAPGGSGASGTAGLVNSGSGGGGGGLNSVTYGSAAGGSGICIFSLPTANYSGTTTGSPTIFTSGSNTILKYTSSGTYTA